MNLQRIGCVLALSLLAIGCGPDRSLLMETKLDAPLRQRVASIQENQLPEQLTVFGKCTSTIDGQMRQSLVEAGADVQTMTNDIFTANISSNRVLDVAELDFVAQLQLSQTSEPLTK